MKSISKKIEAAVAQKTEELLQPLQAPTNIWDAYFCQLETLQSEFPMLDRWKLRISLAIEILERDILEGEDKSKMLSLYNHAFAQMEIQNRINSKYLMDDIEEIEY